MICQCGETIKNPSYTSNSKFDYMCNNCKGYEDEYEVPVTGKGLLLAALDKYNENLLNKSDEEDE
jgi:hypothetical protein